MVCKPLPEVTVTRLYFFSFSSSESPNSFEDAQLLENVLFHLKHIEYTLEGKYQ